MKKEICILSLILLSGIIFGQKNLVFNPSFESYTTCPTGPGDLYKTVGWSACNSSTPDYFNSCALIQGVSTPKNEMGFQIPYNGNAYAGILTYANNQLNREIIIGQLTDTLQTGKKYYVSFLICRGNDNMYNGYATNKFGIKLASTKVSTAAIDNSAKFYNSNVIFDTLNWTRISGSFIADSAYTHLLIGNFFDDSNTSIIKTSSGVWALYYLDDVCLSTDSAFTQNYATEVKELMQNNFSINFFPNPASNFLTVESAYEGAVIRIYDNYGKLVLEKTIADTKKTDIGIQNLIDGVYVLETSGGNRKTRNKLVIFH